MGCIRCNRSMNDMRPITHMTIKTSREYLKGDVLRKKSYPFFLQHASSLDVVVGNNNKNKALQYVYIVLLSKYLEELMKL